MAVQLQLRRGTEAENATFIGANGPSHSGGNKVFLVMGYAA